MSHYPGDPPVIEKTCEHCGHTEYYHSCCVCGAEYKIQYANTFRMIDGYPESTTVGWYLRFLGKPMCQVYEGQKILTTCRECFLGMQANQDHPSYVAWYSQWYPEIGK